MTNFIYPLTKNHFISLKFTKSSQQMLQNLDEEL